MIYEYIGVKWLTDWDSIPKEVKSENIAGKLEINH